ncbi:MAG TPA: hypothetical protein VFU53_09935 [Burkholderiales bacterium]|nr:hypothetical protein [Burkholderiales bacterium]
MAFARLHQHLAGAGRRSSTVRSEAFDLPGREFRKYLFATLLEQLVRHGAFSILPLREPMKLGFGAVHFNCIGSSST